MGDAKIYGGCYSAYDTATEINHIIKEMALAEAQKQDPRIQYDQLERVAWMQIDDFEKCKSNSSGKGCEYYQTFIKKGFVPSPDQVCALFKVKDPSAVQMNRVPTTDKMPASPPVRSNEEAMPIVMAVAAKLKQGGELDKLSDEQQKIVYRTMATASKEPKKSEADVLSEARKKIAEFK